MARVEGVTEVDIEEEKSVRHRHGWWRRHNSLAVRNGELVSILAIAILAGLIATVLTAYLGVR